LDVIADSKVSESELSFRYTGCDTKAW